MEDTEIIRLREEQGLTWIEIGKLAGIKRYQAQYLYYKATGSYTNRLNIKPKIKITVPLGTGKYDHYLNEKINEGKDYKDLLKSADEATRRIAKYRQSNSKFCVS